MSLTNVTSDTGELVAIADAGSATSEQVIQETGSDIISSESDSNTLVSGTAIIDGEELVIIFDDESRVFYTASGVVHTPEGPNTDPFGDGSLVTGATFDETLESYGTDMELYNVSGGANTYTHDTPFGKKSVLIDAYADIIRSTFKYPANKTVLIRVRPHNWESLVTKNIISDRATWNNTARVRAGARTGMIYYNIANNTITTGSLNIAATLDNNVWHTFAFIGAGTVAKLYHNSVLIGNTTLSEATIAGSYTLAFGTAGGSNSGYLEGSLADYLCFNRELTQTEIDRYEVDYSMIISQESYSMDISGISGGKTPVATYKLATYDKDYASVKNVSVDLSLANISDSSVDNTYAITTSAHTNNTTPSTIGQIVPVALTNTAVYTWFDRVTFTQTYITNSQFSTGPASFDYIFNVPTRVDRVRIYTALYNWTPRDWYIQGSHNGVDWVTLLNIANTNMASYTTYIYDFANVDEYTYYRFTCMKLYNDGFNYLALRELWYEVIDQTPDYDLLKTSTPIADGDKIIIVKEDDSVHEVTASGVTGAGPYEMDTTAITAGEVPSKAFLDKYSLSINSRTMILINSSSYIYSTPNVLITKTSEDFLITSIRTITTEVGFYALGNKLTDLTFNAYKDS